MFGAREGEPVFGVIWFRCPSRCCSTHSWDRFMTRCGRVRTGCLSYCLESLSTILLSALAHHRFPGCFCARNKSARRCSLTRQQALFNYCTRSGCLSPYSAVAIAAKISIYDPRGLHFTQLGYNLAFSVRLTRTRRPPQETEIKLRLSFRLRNRKLTVMEFMTTTIHH